MKCQFRSGREERERERKKTGCFPTRRANAAESAAVRANVVDDAMHLRRESITRGRGENRALFVLKSPENVREWKRAICYWAYDWLQTPACVGQSHKQELWMLRTRNKKASKGYAKDLYAAFLAYYMMHRRDY